MIVVAVIATACLASLAVTADRRHRARSMWEAVDLQFRAYSHPDMRAVFPSQSPINHVLRYAVTGWASGALSGRDVTLIVTQLADTDAWAAYWPDAETAWELADPRFVKLVQGALQRR